MEKLATTQMDLEDARARNLKLEQQLLDRDREIAEFRKRFARLGGTDAPERAARAEHLVSPHAIELGRLTGGRDFDGKAGDDGLRVMVVLRDAHGDVIKQAGRTEIELFDLDDGGKVVARWAFDEAATRTAWSSVLTDYHYRFDCPWPTGKPPANPRLTLRVRFSEVAGGRLLSAQAPLDLRLPAGEALDPPTPAPAPMPAPATMPTSATGK